MQILKEMNVAEELDFDPLDAIKRKTKTLAYVRVSRKKASQMARWKPRASFKKRLVTGLILAVPSGRNPH